MPIYVYRNLTTGETFEVAQRITEPALTVHPETGAPLKRLVQPVGIAFKGSGFYVTDSRKAGRSAATAGGNGATGGEAKPASEAATSEGSKTKATTEPAKGGGSAD